jgi:hypothetical protein
MASAASEVATQLARTAAGELVKGQQPLRDVARTIVGEAVVEIDKRGPALAEDAGIMNWRYALLGYVTWHVGKRVIKRKVKHAVGGGSGNGSSGNAEPAQLDRATRGSEEERSSDG